MKYLVIILVSIAILSVVLSSQIESENSSFSQFKPLRKFCVRLSKKLLIAERDVAVQKLKASGKARKKEQKKVVAMSLNVERKERNQNILKITTRITRITKITRITRNQPEN